MVSRALFTFKSNVASLSRGRSYLWTFTFADSVDYVALRVAWNRLLTALRRRLPKWAGVRVYEVHPGRWGLLSHGLHVHVVANAWHDVRLVREVAECCGWGRVHVKRQRGTAKEVLGGYLAKYLAKRRPFALKGWRLWACFNMPDRTRLADVKIDSLRSNLLRIAYQTGVVDGYDWGTVGRIVARWEWQVVAGERLVLPFVWLGRKGAARYFRDRYSDVQLPWAFHPKPAPAPVTGNAAFWSSTSRGEDMTLQDLRREKAFRAFQLSVSGASGSDGGQGGNGVGVVLRLVETFPAASGKPKGGAVLLP